jgi:hypothetical protein
MHAIKNGKEQKYASSGKIRREFRFKFSDI